MPWNFKQTMQYNNMRVTEFPSLLLFRLLICAHTISFADKRGLNSIKKFRVLTCVSYRFAHHAILLFCLRFKVCIWILSQLSHMIRSFCGTAHKSEVECPLLLENETVCAQIRSQNNRNDGNFVTHYLICHLMTSWIMISKTHWY